ncbi:MAG: ATP-dependent Clp protease adaptor ClpS [Chloroflexia bacterium]
MLDFQRWIIRQVRKYTNRDGTDLRCKEDLKMGQGRPINTADATTPSVEELLRRDTLYGWRVLLWNDDVNDMDHVITALIRVVGLDIDRAIQVMLEAHTDGKAVAWSGAKETAEMYRDGLEVHGLTATIEN